MVSLENKKSQNQLNKFSKCLAKLAPSEFIGVCRLMNVEFYRIKTEEELKAEADSNPDATPTKVEPRDAELIINEMIQTFMEWNRTKRRNLMKILEAATKKRG